MAKSRRIKVCQVLNAYTVGGAETVALDVARKLDAERFESIAVAVIEPDAAETPEMQRRFLADGVPATALHHRSFRDPRTLWNLHRFFRRERPDIVHGHNRWSDYWACRVARWARVPHAIWTRHSVYLDMTGRQLQRYRSLAARTPAILAVSDAVHRNCLETEQLPPERVHTVVNGIDTDRFRPLAAAARAAVRGELGLADDEQMLILVGRLIPEKAPEAFLALVKKLRDRGLPVRGFIGGRGPLGDALATDAPAAGVTMLGLRNDVPALLGASDLVVSTSRVEGLPLNLMEAMAAGAAFVGPDLDQVRQLVSSSPELSSCLYGQPPRHGEVPAGLIDTWADVATEHLRDPGRRARHGELGRRIIVEQFSLDRMVRQHEAIYQTLVSGN